MGNAFVLRSDALGRSSRSHVAGDSTCHHVTFRRGQQSCLQRHLSARRGSGDFGDASGSHRPWQQAAALEVPTDGGDVEFTIPKPALESAFFRLTATFRAATATDAQLSAELQYVTMPPLGPVFTNVALRAEAVFHFKGVIDGSDRIRITREGAFWEHVNWGWPAGMVTVNGSQWNPEEKNYLTTTGAVAFLPETYSLDSASLEIVEGRDMIALERTTNALMVYLDDTPPGAAPYEFKIHFHPAAAKTFKIHTSPAATLKIAAQIDGSDLLQDHAPRSHLETPGVFVSCCGQLE